MLRALMKTFLLIGGIIKEVEMMNLEVKQDEWGPEKILSVYDPKTGMKGFTIVDNTALGPGKGGIRMVPDVTVGEVFGLARAMTWKNALAELPFGGAKSGVIWDGKKDKEALIRAFARAVKPLIPDYYIAGPDMNTTEKEMAAIADELGTNKASTGKPSEMGGLPHELGSTGYGVFESADVTVDFLGWDMSKVSVAIEGFGNVGTFAAKFLSEKGAKIVAVSDSKGTIYNPEGMNVEKLIQVKNETGAVKNYGKGKILEPEKLFELPVDILIPGARPNVITDENKERVKAKVIIEAANIPIPIPVEDWFYEKGILIVPDFVCNAGGVISSYVEFIGGNEKQMFEIVKEKVRHNTELVLKKSKEEKMTPRNAALKIAQERVREAMDKRK
ncbi:MAG: Glu/Leu/Phe/Val dehydrogenase [Candidatus Aenigmarchaeota archaeon CG_4_10_14_0_8_um_filter_37_24]|nr:MAG: Glu/Leu/Phe/Val dehydrogenase [Candidatus Aenigmarchaeota archaeon CG_4_10_14_3_um_filter_37_21]PIZ35457.1 MAG: Glu/Leu/Phe/Val dehydrogenase [Candidatus Aenigmarchaeota archaeon CG_4_10_14_0_8_um_filter_37_24]